MSTPDRLAVFSRLRGQLDIRAPQAGREIRATRSLPTGVAAIDEPLGGLAVGAVTELICSSPSCGGHLLLASLLVSAREERQRVALIDAADAFDPCSHPADLYRHLVWVRCPGVAAALQVADLMVRDANFGLVVVDLKHVAPRELRRTPATMWYRLQRATAPAALALLILTGRPTVPSAQLRLELNQSFTAAAWSQERATLLTQLLPVVQRQRMHTALEAEVG